MKRQQQDNGEQLDLPLPDGRREERRKLDPEICKEVTKLLELLLTECGGGDAARTKGARDEQDQR